MQRRLNPLTLPAVVLSASLGCGGSLDDDGDGFSELTNDCDDTDPNVHPDAVEVCYNGIDDNCDGQMDEEGATSGRVWYVDLDGDGYGSEEYTVNACEQPAGFAAQKWDCNESDPTIHPGAAEVCDYIDNDCDDEVDETTSEDAQTWYPDRDGDGYGDPENAVVACEAPAGYTAEGGDCADLDPLQSPDATEDCRTEADDDCDGTPNGEDAYGCTAFYADLDGDGFPGTEACLCAATEDFATTEATDCDDTRDDVYPGAPITQRFALEDCTADTRIDTSTADHELDIGSHTASYDDRTFYQGVVHLDATGDGIDDLAVGTVTSPAHLLEGPVTDHADLGAPLAVLPSDETGIAQTWMLVVPDQDGDGLEDIVQVQPGSTTTPSGLYAFSSASRGTLTLDDALWFVAANGPLREVVRLFPAPEDGLAQLVVNGDRSSDFTVHALQEAGTPPTLLGTVEDALGTGFAVAPGLRVDVTGDGVPEMVLTQGTYGFLPQHTWTGGNGVYTARSALAILEPFSDADPLDLDPLHVVYGWSNLGDEGRVTTRDLDGDGLPDLLAAEASGALEANSGAVWGFTSDSLLGGEDDYTLIQEADAIYSGGHNDNLRWVFETADLDGDGAQDLWASGTSGDQWLLDRFPLGHHSLRTLARPMDRTTVFASVGDANGDGIDDLATFDGLAGTQTLRFFWGEQR